MRIEPVKGTADYLPNEAELREYMQNSILSTYKASGFMRIYTPAIEDAENLDKSEGGENLNLIFKILKRGQKLETALSDGNMNQLADLGLRYDLTLPLSRYYANNRQKLMTPFKCIQMDRVFRAERPQKGRSRELMQCDIDIIGSTSVNCEIELIHVTAKALLNLGLQNFKVKVNDRRILKGLLLHLGFLEDELASVCITFDKLDKVGAEGVLSELTDKGFDIQKVNALWCVLLKFPFTLDDLSGAVNDTEALCSIQKIIDSVKALSEGQYEIEFDLSLTRGQGYYTGTVFEIKSMQWSGSIAGGGRYDNLIGKFNGETIPAVGFSIGFERIYGILSERGFSIPKAKQKIALVYDSDLLQAEKAAVSLRSDFEVTLIERPKKLGKLAASLQANGYDGMYICGKSEAIDFFNKNRGNT